MESYVSGIKPIELNKTDIYSFIVFQRVVSVNDLKYLEEEFGFTQEAMDFYSQNYRPYGIIFKLMPASPDSNKDWKPFLAKVFKPAAELSRFNNVFFNKNYDKLLLVTNKRLLKLDLKNVNEKIMDINFRIESYNEKLEKDVSELEGSSQEKGFFGRIIEAFHR